MPLSRTNAKNKLGSVWMKVLIVSRNVRHERQRVVMRVRREGDDWEYSCKFLYQIEGGVLLVSMLLLRGQGI